MITNTELETSVNKLKEDMLRLQTSNSDLRDEVHVLKNNYSTLVEEMSTRLEVIQKKFRSQ